MRRFTLSRTALPFRAVTAAVAALGALALTACEDGPTQTFQPAPAGAAGTWNGAGDAASSTDPATQGFTQQQTGQNAQILCTGMEREAMWGWALKQPIVLPNVGGGLDLSGGPTWKGLTVNQAQIPARDASGNLIIPPPPCGVAADGGPTACGICQGDSLGNEFGDNDEVVGWGDSDEIWMHYPPSTLIGNFLVFFQGYLGTVSMKSRMNGRFGTHTYQIPIATAQVSRDSGPFTINWHAPHTPTDWRNELNDALVATFAPGLPSDPDCNVSRTCIQGSFGDVAYLYMTSIGFAIWTPNQNAPQPTPSLMNRLDLYIAKVLPFAFASPMLQINQAGPLTNPVLEGNATAPCSLNLGSTYGDFLANCVKVSGNSAQDTVEENKLLGGILHDTETYSFNVQGIDLNFGDGMLAADSVVSDTDRPVATDPATSFSVDQSTLGAIANDYPGNDPITNTTADLHGAGLVYFEYAELVQSQINALMTAQDPNWVSHQLGDPLCTGLDASGNPLTDLTIATRHCTGFEGMVNVLPSTALPGLAQGLGVGPTSGAASFGLGGLKPGHHTVTFCDDVVAPGGVPDLAHGYKNCSATGDTFPASLARVQKIVGYRGVGTLPPSLQDARFFFQQWFRALVGYLEVADQITSASTAGALAMVDASTANLDQYDLFNDSIGAGQFEIAEYIDRTYASTTQPPLDIVFTADVKNGIMNSYQFSRFNYRGEAAIYTSMIDHRGPTEVDVPRTGCTTDSDCGSATSGIVCDVSSCQAGCRGTGGNACYKGTCSSTTNAIGQCIVDDPPGKQDNALLSNMFGSLALHNAYPGFTVTLEGGFTDNTSYDGYYCATHVDRQNCCTKLADGVTCNSSTIVTAPLDAAACAATHPDPTPLSSCDIMLVDQNNQPILAAYEGAFGTAQTAWTLGFPSASTNLFTPVAVNATYNDIQAAKITIPLHTNPYNLSSPTPTVNGTAMASITKLVPWAPKQPGIGFPVAVDGTRDLFVETYQLDMTGTTITANIDYDFTVDKTTHLVTDQVNFLAVETTDFLGDLFICQDPTTKDLLSVHMYTSVADVLSWFSEHPGAYVACGMITRYSPYGNYADYITTSNNGVRLGITQGGGYGRVVDGTEWATNLVTIPPQ